jgi:hypothetical protein
MNAFLPSTMSIGSTAIPSQCFAAGKSLITLNAPSASVVGYYACANLSTLKEVNAPNL